MANLAKPRRPWVVPRHVFPSVGYAHQYVDCDSTNRVDPTIKELSKLRLPLEIIHAILDDMSLGTILDLVQHHHCIGRVTEPRAYLGESLFGFFNV